MKPEDLLRRINFDFTVLSPKEHAALYGVQVTAEPTMFLTVDIVFNRSARTRTANG